MATASAAQATTSQMWYLHILAKRDTKSLTLSKDDASILIDYYRGQQAVKKLTNGHSHLAELFGLDLNPAPVKATEIESKPDPIVEEPPEPVKVPEQPTNNHGYEQQAGKCPVCNSREILLLTNKSEIKRNNFDFRFYGGICQECHNKRMDWIQRVLDGKSIPIPADKSYGDRITAQTPSKWTSGIYQIKNGRYYTTKRDPEHCNYTDKTWYHWLIKYEQKLKSPEYQAEIAAQGIVAAVKPDGKPTAQDKADGKARVKAWLATK